MNKNRNDMRVITMGTWVLAICQKDGELTVEVQRGDYNPVGTLNYETEEGWGVCFTPEPMTVGDRVALTRDVERFPSFVAYEGMRGTIKLMDAKAGVFSVEMDDHIDGCEEWENCIDWHDDMGDDWAHDVRPITDKGCGYFWNHEYRHYLRPGYATDEERRRVKEAFIENGLPLGGESDAHLDIIKRKTYPPSATEPASSTS